MGNSGGLTVAKVRCLHGNQWLIVKSRFTQNNELADGVGLVHQTKPGRFVGLGSGSDWTGADDNLRAKGVPDDVILELPGDHSRLTSSAPATDVVKHPFSDFVGSWGGHERLLEIKADHTGKFVIGSGCCDSVGVAMTFAMQPDGRLAGTATGKPTYTGTAMNNVKFGTGPSVWFYFQNTDQGEFLMSDGPGDITGVPWCSGAQMGMCGA
jgi:hypothetical protein